MNAFFIFNDPLESSSKCVISWVAVTLWNKSVAELDLSASYLQAAARFVLLDIPRKRLLSRVRFQSKPCGDVFWVYIRFSLFLYTYIYIYINIKYTIFLLYLPFSFFSLYSSNPLLTSLSFSWGPTLILRAIDCEQGYRGLQVGGDR